MRALLVLGTALGVLVAAGSARAESAGAMLYRRYCASCHGESGKGDGPAASAFKVPPTDLTGLAARGDGSARVDALMAAIDGRRTIPAHGSRTMPVWGEAFAEELAGKPHAGRTVLLQVREIAEHVAAMQRK